MEKDIILIIGGGGMSGIFSSGVLKAFEDSEISNRIDSIYAVSVGACTGARFLARESELGGRTFYTRFNTDRFISAHFVKYFFQVLQRKRSLSTKKVDEILDFRYFTDVLLSSEDKIDMGKVEASPIPFYVKVFNKNKILHQYLPVRGPHAFDRVLASASMTPLTSLPNIIDSEEFFDGDTIPSNLEADIAKRNPDKLVIKIDNSRNSFLGDFNLFALVVVYTLLRSMYGTEVSNLYFKNFFKRPFWRKRFRKYPNTLIIENDVLVSSFEKNTELLKKTYYAGLAKGNEISGKLLRPRHKF